MHAKVNDCDYTWPTQGYIIGCSNIIIKVKNYLSATGLCTKSLKHINIIILEIFWGSCFFQLILLFLGKFSDIQAALVIGTWLHQCFVNLWWIKLYFLYISNMWLVLSQSPINYLGTFILWCGNGKGRVWGWSWASQSISMSHRIEMCAHSTWF